MVTVLSYLDERKDELEGSLVCRLGFPSGVRLESWAGCASFRLLGAMLSFPGFSWSPPISAGPEDSRLMEYWSFKRTLENIWL